MKKVITRKSDNAVVMTCSKGILDVENNAILTEDNSYLVPASDFNIYEVADDTAFEPEKQLFDGVNIINNPDYVAPPLTQEEELKLLKNAMKSADQKYKELSLTTASLSDAKVAKLNQINELCNKVIVSGFNCDVNGVSYRFSCSVEAQANFTGTQYKFDKGEITSVYWTALNNTNGKIERVLLNAAAFKPVADAVFPHINSNISRFRDDLQPQVEAAATNSEVDAIVW